MSTFSLIVTAIAFFMLGLLPACLVTLLLGLAGLPGGLIAMSARKSAIVYGIGVLIVILCQSYVALAFAAAIVESARSIVGNATGVGKWIFWISAFMLAGSPTAMASKSAASWRDETREGRSPASMVSVQAMALPVAPSIGSKSLLVWPEGAANQSKEIVRSQKERKIKTMPLMRRKLAQMSV